jgi:hypothetical protein
VWANPGDAPLVYILERLKLDTVSLELRDGCPYLYSHRRTLWITKGDLAVHRIHRNSNSCAFKCCRIACQGRRKEACTVYNTRRPIHTVPGQPSKTDLQPQDRHYKNYKSMVRITDLLFSVHRSPPLPSPSFLNLFQHCFIMDFLYVPTQYSSENYSSFVDSETASNAPGLSHSSDSSSRCSTPKSMFTLTGYI